MWVFVWVAKLEFIPSNYLLVSHQFGSILDLGTFLMNFLVDMTCFHLIFLYCELNLFTLLCSTAKDNLISTLYSLQIYSNHNFPVKDL